MTVSKAKTETMKWISATKNTLTLHRLKPALQIRKPLSIKVFIEKLVKVKSA